MHFHFSNVNDAFEEIVTGITNGTIPTVLTTSRVGDVAQIPEPVIITYHLPQQRVLFNRYRDANPFFHVYESLWMLAGRNDVAPLEYYNSKIGEIASDDGETFNGAYGYRWRHPRVDRKVQVDQLDVIVEHLKDKPGSRRVVLQMWNVDDDLLKIDSSKDVCCNTNAYFSIRGQTVPTDDPTDTVQYLDMTVCNRSNDIVWGMLGANVVHFSFPQEYLATRLGVKVGYYHQISNNAHVYTERFKPEIWMKEYGARLTMHDPEPRPNPYVDIDFYIAPLVRDPAVFDQEVKTFVEVHRDGGCLENPPMYFSEPFLDLVAKPMSMAFHCHKLRHYSKAIDWARTIDSTDWRVASIEWLERRERQWKIKNNIHQS